MLIIHISHIMTAKVYLKQRIFSFNIASNNTQNTLQSKSLVACSMNATSHKSWTFDWTPRTGVRVEGRGWGVLVKRGSEK